MRFPGSTDDLPWNPSIAKLFRTPSQHHSRPALSLIGVISMHHCNALTGIFGVALCMTWVALGPAQAASPSPQKLILSPTVIREVSPLVVDSDLTRSCRTVENSVDGRFAQCSRGNLLVLNRVDSRSRAAGYVEMQRGQIKVSASAYVRTFTRGPLVGGISRDGSGAAYGTMYASSGRYVLVVTGCTSSDGDLRATEQCLKGIVKAQLGRL